MNRYPHTPLQISRSATNTDVASYFDYQSALALRKMALVQGCGMPKYLLAPEVAILLSYLPDLRQRTF
ncbi:MAG: tyrosine-type recombinase/integrase, partial [Plesiomonas shigelloides]